MSAKSHICRAKKMYVALFYACGPFWATDKKAIYVRGSFFWRLLDVRVRRDVTHAYVTFSLVGKCFVRPCCDMTKSDVL